MLNQLDASSWEKWKKSLGNMVSQAEKIGVSQNMLEEFAVEFGDFLDANISPDIPENKAMKELWEVANEEEQKTLARLMIKLSRNS
ncbi:MAG: DUF3243 domain-containing protein [Thermoanaerobacteraceae bacterium]|nr:DUF3243 domain-containing protein [Thermoanaerobacteraceae bacterium]